MEDLTALERHVVEMAVRWRKSNYEAAEPINEQSFWRAVDLLISIRDEQERTQNTNREAE